MARAAHDLCRGPGNLTKAMGIGPADNRADLTRVRRRGDGLWIEDRGIAVDAVAWTPRIGIRVGTDRAWRCVVAGQRGGVGEGRLGTQKPEVRRTR